MSAARGRVSVDRLAAAVVRSLAMRGILLFVLLALGTGGCGGDAGDAAFSGAGSGGEAGSGGTAGTGGAVTPTDAAAGSAGTATGGTGGGTPVCAPGKQEACACPGGAQGAQKCNATGTGYGDCACPDSPDAGPQERWWCEADPSGHGCHCTYGSTGKGSTSACAPSAADCCVSGVAHDDVSRVCDCFDSSGDAAMCSNMALAYKGKRVAACP